VVTLGPRCAANWKPGDKTIVADPDRSLEYFESANKGVQFRLPACQLGASPLWPCHVSALLGAAWHALHAAVWSPTRFSRAQPDDASTCGRFLCMTCSQLSLARLVGCGTLGAGITAGSVCLLPVYAGLSLLPAARMTYE